MSGEERKKMPLIEFDNLDEYRGSLDKSVRHTFKWKVQSPLNKYCRLLFLLLMASRHFFCVLLLMASRHFFCVEGFLYK